MSNRCYDVIVIGGGHNGLVTACYLAKAGKSVCVLERRDILGGCSSTEELWPGFKISPAAYVISLFLPRIMNDLKLEEHGLKILPRNPACFKLMPDGRSFILGHNEKENYKEISRFSKKDADAFIKYNAFLTKIAEAVEQTLDKSFPPLPVRARDIFKWFKMVKPFWPLRKELQDVTEVMTGAATPILERWFETESLKATLATDAIIGAFISPSMAGSAYVLLHHVMGEAGGKRGVWGYVQGGMGELATALENSAKELDVDIIRNAEVQNINITKTKKGNQVTGVTLTNGNKLNAKVIASSVDPNLTFMKLLGEQYLSDEYTEKIKKIDYKSASAKLNLALDRLPSFKNTDNRDLNIALRGTTHISPTMEYIEKAYDYAKYGLPSDKPILEITIPSLVDPTLAPKGKHVMQMFIQYAPYEIQGGWNDTSKDAFIENCFDVLYEYAPDIRDVVLHKQLLTPVDLEQKYGLTGGNIFQGSMNLHNLGPFRIRPETPVKGLYLCGASIHPGGGVMGACGMNAANVILNKGV